MSVVNNSKEYFIPSSNDQKFNFTNQDIFSYIKFSKDIIKSSRVGEIDNKIIEDNSPFVLVPDDKFKNPDGKYQKSIILMHGLYDSPYTWREAAEYLVKKGFYVVAPLIPGHGTKSGDLLNVKWLDFVEILDSIVDILKNQSEEVNLGGYSAGGAACLNYYQNNQNNIKSIMLISPAIELYNNLAWIAQYMNYVGIDWHNQRPETNPVKYQSVSYNSVAQIYLLTEANRLLLNKEIDIPTLIFSSNYDTTTSVEALKNLWHTKINHPQSKFYLYTSNNETIPNSITAIPITEEDGILSMSHVSILASSEDGYYGKNGSIKDCNAYFDKNKEKYDMCMRSSNVVIAENTEEFMQKAVIQRSTYNPKFDQFLGLIDEFYDSI